MLNEKDILSAKTDAKAFAMSPGHKKVELVQRLLNDPLTAAFSPEIVRWLVDSLVSHQMQVAEKDNHIRNLKLDLIRARQKADIQLQFPSLKFMEEMRQVLVAVRDLHDIANGAAQGVCDVQSVYADLGEWERKYGALLEISNNAES